MVREGISRHEKVLVLMGLLVVRKGWAGLVPSLHGPGR